MIGIYKITNLKNNKNYIGQTKDVKKRFAKHKSNLKNGCHHNEYLQRAWKKYGVEGFKFEFLCECKTCELDDKEVYYIEEYKSMVGQKGYNMLTGGQLYRTHSQEVKAKISKAHKGKVLTTETKTKMSVSALGKKYTKESIQKSVDTKKKNRVLAGEKNGNAIITNEIAEKIIIDLYNNIDKKVILKKYDITYNILAGLVLNRTYIYVLPEFRQAIKNSCRNEMQIKHKKILDLYSKGVSQNKISKLLNTSRNTIRAILKENNIIS